MTIKTDYTELELELHQAGVEYGNNRLKLVPENSPILRTKAKPVIKPTSGERTSLTLLGRYMIELMIQENGIGLAAPQVGISRRVFVCDFRDPDLGTQFCVNPVWRVYNPMEVDDSNFRPMFQSQEGCLSLPGRTVTVPRYEMITATWHDVDGKERIRNLYGLDAIVFQHEFDHLEGKLITDYLTIL